ncbi:unnamed protein product [Ceutorhynchus assimilis]|uniref:Uncharacterized protein n=1 Tax=Ceutorhynchus assimilis TaxID=467358 RepID=A0A9N9MQ01_9CUCU|nr:unnamed protein product [Ceutorhynchus assimilis]
MDVLVLWEDGSRNVVSSNELKTDKYKRFKVGNKVHMKYNRKWYHGIILDVENLVGSDSEDEIPLSKLLKSSSGNEQATNRNELVHAEPGEVTTYNDLFISQAKPEEKAVLEPEVLPSINVGGDNEILNVDSDKENSFIDDYASPSDDYDSDADPPFGQCHVKTCKGEVFAACHRCDFLLCFDHFNEDVENCKYHGINTVYNTGKAGPNRCRKALDKKALLQVSSQISQQNKEKTKIVEHPEGYLVEGASEERTIAKKKRINKSKEAKLLRNSGQEYFSLKTKKKIPARQIKERCDGQKWDLAKQREFLVRHVQVLPKKRSTTVNSDSRRKNSRLYVLTVNNNQIMVCKRFFFNTLGIPERTFRTAFSKITATGTIEKEMRGGRQRSVAVKNKERENRNEIEAHIDRYPRVESHFCRSSTSRMYLHPDLSLKKIYKMFVEEQESKKNTNIPSLTTYRRIFKAKNLSFLRPKKDQCSLCLSFKEGDAAIKEDLKDRYEKHILEKQLVRQKKSESKEKAKTDSDILCAVFDLQQVIYLPISQESAIFYKSRMSVFNFTFYNVATRECYCFVWDETNGKRGSTEIATCLFRAIGQYVGKGVHTIELFCDGCYGQNKNSVVASMLLYSLAKYNTIKNITLKFFETNHGQNEGDSAHSAIGYALAHSGDLFVPSQLYPVIRGARTQPKPYTVIPMSFGDFLDFKTFSKNLRLLSVRQSEKNRSLKWTEIMDLSVNKEGPMSIFFKYSHAEESYDKIVLKQRGGISHLIIDNLNKEQIKISRKKYEDLTALCKPSGRNRTAVIRTPELQNFFYSLPHEEDEK